MLHGSALRQVDNSVIPLKYPNNKQRGFQVFGWLSLGGMSFGEMSQHRSAMHWLNPWPEMCDAFK